MNVANLIIVYYLCVIILQLKQDPKGVAAILCETNDWTEFCMLATQVASLVNTMDHIPTIPATNWNKDAYR